MKKLVPFFKVVHKHCEKWKKTSCWPQTYLPDLEVADITHRGYCLTSRFSGTTFWLQETGLSYTFPPSHRSLCTSDSLKLFGVSKTKPPLTCNCHRRILISGSAFTEATKNLESFLGNAVLFGDSHPAVTFYNQPLKSATGCELFLVSCWKDVKDRAINFLLCAQHKIGTQ